MDTKEKSSCENSKLSSRNGKISESGVGWVPKVTPQPTTDSSNVNVKIRKMAPGPLKYTFLDELECYIGARRGSTSSMWTGSLGENCKIDDGFEEDRSISECSYPNSLLFVEKPFVTEDGEIKLTPIDCQIKSGYTSQNVPDQNDTTKEEGFLTNDRDVHQSNASLIENETVPSLWNTDLSSCSSLFSCSNVNENDIPPHTNSETPINGSINETSDINECQNDKPSVGKLPQTLLNRFSKSVKEDQVKLRKNGEKFNMTWNELNCFAEIETDSTTTKKDSNDTVNTVEKMSETEQEGLEGKNKSRSKGWNKVEESSHLGQINEESFNLFLNADECVEDEALLSLISPRVEKDYDQIMDSIRDTCAKINNGDESSRLEDGETMDKNHLFQLYIKEQEKRKEANQILVELQTSYAGLMSKLAGAENFIDRLRLGEIKFRESVDRQPSLFCDLEKFYQSQPETFVYRKPSALEYLASKRSQSSTCFTTGDSNKGNKVTENLGTPKSEDVAMGDGEELMDEPTSTEERRKVENSSSGSDQYWIFLQQPVQTSTPQVPPAKYGINSEDFISDETESSIDTGSECEIVLSSPSRAYNTQPTVNSLIMRAHCLQEQIELTRAQLASDEMTSKGARDVVSHLHASLKVLWSDFLSLQKQEGESMQDSMPDWKHFEDFLRDLRCDVALLISSATSASGKKLFSPRIESGNNHRTDDADSEFVKSTEEARRVCGNGCECCKNPPPNQGVKSSKRRGRRKNNSSEELRRLLEAPLPEEEWTDVSSFKSKMRLAAGASMCYEDEHHLSPEYHHRTPCSYSRKNASNPSLSLAKYCHSPCSTHSCAGTRNTRGNEELIEKFNHLILDRFWNVAKRSTSKDSFTQTSEREEMRGTKEQSIQTVVDRCASPTDGFIYFPPQNSDRKEEGSSRGHAASYWQSRWNHLNLASKASLVSVGSAGITMSVDSALGLTESKLSPGNRSSDSTGSLKKAEEVTIETRIRPEILNERKYILRSLNEANKLAVRLKRRSSKLIRSMSPVQLS